jgi:hypothetical protein
MKTDTKNKLEKRLQILKNGSPISIGKYVYIAEKQVVNGATHYDILKLSDMDKTLVGQILADGKLFWFV